MAKTELQTLAERRRASAYGATIRAEEGVGIFPTAPGGIHRQIGLMHQGVLTSSNGLKAEDSYCG